MPRREESTGATVCYTLIAQGPLARSVTMRDTINAHPNHTHKRDIPLSMEMSPGQDQVAPNAIVCLAVTPLILMNVMMALELAALMTSIQDISVMMEISKRLKEYQAPLTAKLSAKTIMGVSFSLIGLKKVPKTGAGATSTGAATSLLMKSVENGTNVTVDQSTQIWMIAASLNCIKIEKNK